MRKVWGRPGHYYLRDELNLSDLSVKCYFLSKELQGSLCVAVSKSAQRMVIKMATVCSCVSCVTSIHISSFWQLLGLSLQEPSLLHWLHSVWTWRSSTATPSRAWAWQAKPIRFSLLKILVLIREATENNSCWNNSRTLTAQCPKLPLFCFLQAGSFHCPLNFLNYPALLFPSYMSFFFLPGPLFIILLACSQGILTNSTNCIGKGKSKISYKL